ncbi:MAG: hypothetical protein MUF31_06725 [Akkermansiaceae bacterium]|nr:hypothetical protein [Akkermansiaceae bacterium]
MKSYSLVPDSTEDAAERLSSVKLQECVCDLSLAEFLRAWFAVAYLFPGLHPDDFDMPDGNWPSDLQTLALEAWSRSAKGAMPDVFLYPADSQWAGIYDRMQQPASCDSHRRDQIRSNYSLPFID